MTNWECPKCHAANKADDASCRNCSWEKNSAASLRDTLREQRRGILSDIQKDLSSALRDARSSLAGLEISMPDLSSIDVKMPDLAGAGTKPSSPGTAPRPATPFERITTRNLQVEIRALPRLSYALTHAGLPLIHSLEIKNTSAEPANDLLARVWVAPDYGEPWQKSVPAIPAGSVHTESNVVIPLSRNRLQEVREAEKAGLRLDVLTEGSLQYSETLPLEVLAYNDWYYHPAVAQTIACFVQPNSTAVERIVSLAQARLRRASCDDSLSGYQSGDPRKVLEMVEAVYMVLREDLRIGYINPPASFEKGEQLPDGSYTLWQKIFFPEQILEYRRGTCLDLAVLCASCLERIGLHPLVFIIKGHAFFGVWTRAKTLDAPVLLDVRAAGTLVSEGEWVPLNSVTFTSNVPKGFAQCIAEGMQCLMEKPGDFHCAIDIKSARFGQPPMKPLPPL